VSESSWAATPADQREPRSARLAHYMLRGLSSKTMRATETSFWLKRIPLLIVFWVSVGSAASAQSRPDVQSRVESTLIPGTTVWITDSSGREEKTRIVDVSGNIVTTSAGDHLRRIQTAEIKRVRVRHSDGVINGALIGAGAAMASGLFLCRLTESWENCRDDVGPMLRIGALGAGAGIAIDALIRGRKTIYEAADGAIRVHAAPIVARHAGGVQVSLSF
jgi:hypothetical protein